MNFDRAKRMVFETLKADAAIFLDDDMTLGRDYLAALDTLTGWAPDDLRMGFVTAYGKHKLTLEQQQANRLKMCMMSQNWAFATTRQQWLAQRPFVLQFLDLVSGGDYPGRPHGKIADLFQSWGLGFPGTSQDIATSHAAIQTGASKVSTVACFDRYIGAKGVHLTPEQCAAQGYETSWVVDEPPDLEPPSIDELATCLRTARRSAMVHVEIPR